MFSSKGQNDSVANRTGGDGEQQGVVEDLVSLAFPRRICLLTFSMSKCCPVNQSAPVEIRASVEIPRFVCRGVIIMRAEKARG